MALPPKPPSGQFTKEFLKRLREDLCRPKGLSAPHSMFEDYKASPMRSSQSQSQSQSRTITGRISSGPSLQILPKPKPTAVMEMEMTEEEYWSYATSTEPVDRPRAEKAIKQYLKRRNRNADRQFVWCNSPQTALCIIKLVSELQESKRPQRPQRPQKPTRRQIHRIDYEITRAFPTDISIGRIFRTEISVGGIFHTEVSGQIGIIRTLLNSSLGRGTSLPMSEDENNSHLLDVALQNISPGLDKIKLIDEGQPLKLEEFLWGQHFLYEIITDSNTAEIVKSCGWIWIYPRHIFVSERPNILQTNNEHQLHSTTGPAIQYPDGFSVYCVDGVKVPEYVITDPSKIRPWRINKEENIEVRRIMMDRYCHGQEVHGIGAYVRDSKAKRLDHDEARGTLWHLPVNGHVLMMPAGFLSMRDEEDIVMLEVVNSTPEPDGHFKHYWLRVPPHIRTARAASAWTFNVDEDEYNPLEET